MLVLSRKRNEVIVIETSDGLIEIHVCGFWFSEWDSSSNFKVKLGIEAPRNVAVNRKEIYESKRAERHED